MYKSRVDEHKKLCDDIHELYVKKNKDYGGSVTDTYKKYGMISFLVRMEDKLNRVESLTKNTSIEIKTESVRDTLIDLANYALLAVLELDDEEKQRKVVVEESQLFEQNLVYKPFQIKPESSGYVTVECRNKEL